MKFVGRCVCVCVLTLGGGEDRDGGLFTATVTLRGKPTMSKSEVRRVYCPLPRFPSFLSLFFSFILGEQPFCVP